jgi:hypothetical protein
MLSDYILFVSTYQLLTCDFSEVVPNFNFLGFTKLGLLPKSSS